jgi:hypothetical protein
MTDIDRRRLFKLAGAGSVVAAAGAALPIVGRITSQDSNVFGFRATLGLPEPPLPNYATYIVEGTLNLASGTGLVTSRVLAGHPDATSEIGLPGLARIVRVVGVDQQGSQLSVRGVVEDRSQLQPGESPQVELVIDRARGVVQASFVGRPVTLTLS